MTKFSNEDPFSEVFSPNSHNHKYHHGEKPDGTYEEGNLNIPQALSLKIRDNPLNGLELRFVLWLLTETYDRSSTIWIHDHVLIGAYNLIDARRKYIFNICDWTWLAGRLNVDKVAMMQLIERLIEKGFIKLVDGGDHQILSLAMENRLLSNLSLIYWAEDFSGEKEAERSYTH